MTIGKKTLATRIALGLVDASGTAFALWSSNASGQARTAALTAQTCQRASLEVALRPTGTKS